MEMWLSHRPTSLIGVLCLSLIPLTALAKDKVEAPQGYEEAANPEKPRPPKKPSLEEKIKSVFDLEEVLPLQDKNVDPQILNLEKQFLTQFKGTLKSELAFVRRACKLDKPQLKPIAKAAEQQLPVALRQYAVAVSKRGGRQRNITDPRELIQQQCMKFVKEKLSPKQLKLYQQECKKRAASRKLAVVRYLVASMDRQLLLSAEQRQKLIKLALKNYDNSWPQSMQLWMHNSRFIPQLSKKSVLSVLSDTQKKIWKQIPRQNHHMFLGAGLMQNVVIIEDE